MSVDEVTTLVTASYFPNLFSNVKGLICSVLTLAALEGEPFLDVNGVVQELTVTNTSQSFNGMHACALRERCLDFDRVVDGLKWASCFTGTEFRHVSQFCECGHNIKGDWMIRSQTKLDSRTLWSPHCTLLL